MNLGLKTTAGIVLAISLFGIGHPALAQATGGPNKTSTSERVEILSDAKGVDFGPYLDKTKPIIEATWKPLIPKEVSPPTNLAGVVKIRFSIMPNGKLEPKSMVLEGRSGYVSLDRAAWGAIVGSAFPPLPEEFKGKRLTLRFTFKYNTR